MSKQNEAEATIVISSGSRKLTLALRKGYTAERVLELMNDWRAQIQGNEIICYPESASDGYYVLADIVAAQNGYQTDSWVQE